MAVDTNAYYRLLVEWKDGDTVLGDIGEEHSFRDWTAELGVSSSVLIGTMEYYNGSDPLNGRPLWFLLIATPPININFKDLNDAPHTYAGQAGKQVRVKNDESGVEFVVPSVPAHAATHKAGGTDELKMDELGLPTNTTFGNVNTSRHGWAPRGTGNPLEFLNGVGTYTVPAGTGSVSNFVELGDVPNNYTGAAGMTVSVNRAGNGLVFGNPALPSIDMGLLFPQIRGKDFTHMDTDKDICGADLGMLIGDYQTEFPNFYYYLHTDAGWTDPQILGLTYFASAWNEISFMTYDAGTGFPFHRYSISIPEGKQWYNCELRGGQNIMQGAGAFYYFGFGSTELALTKTNWKSLYGSQNDGVYMGVTPWTYAGEEGLSVYPLVLGGGFEYAHNMLLRDVCMSGTAGDFNDHTYREVLYNYWSPGENSGAENCLFVGSNDFGMLITGACAYANWRNCSFFSNNVAGIGIRGVSRSTIQGSFSGDFNPWALYTFRQSETLTAPNRLSANTTTTGGFTMPAVAATTTVTVASAAGMKLNHEIYITGAGYFVVTNIASLTITIRNNGANGNVAASTVVASGKVTHLPFWPCYQNGNPGGNIDIKPYKHEAFACDSGFAGYTACTPDQPGKGQQFARLTGRFHFSCLMGTATAHEGIVDTLVTVMDDFDMGVGGIPLSNSSVNLQNIGSVRFRHWLHDMKRDKKWQANAIDDDSHGTGILWTDNYNTAQAYDPLRVGFSFPSIAATYPWRIPFSNDGTPVTYNQSTGPTAGQGRDDVTGVHF